MSMREVFNQEQIDLLIEALDRAQKFHKGAHKRIMGSGFGKASTQLKAEEQLDKADKLRELETFIANESI